MSLMSNSIAQYAAEKNKQ